MKELNLEFSNPKESTFINAEGKADIVKIVSESMCMSHAVHLGVPLKIYKIHLTPDSEGNLPPDWWYQCAAKSHDEAMWAVLRALDCHISQPRFVYQELEKYGPVTKVKQVELKWG